MYHNSFINKSPILLTLNTLDHLGIMFLTPNFIDFYLCPQINLLLYFILIRMKTEEILIVHPDSKEQLNVIKAILQTLKIKFEFSKNEEYNPNFVAKIEKSRQDYKDGKGKVYSQEELNNLWK